MKHFKLIIEQSTPPATNALWLNGTVLKYFTNGEWKVIGEQPVPVPVPAPVEEYVLPTATTTRLGGVKKASGIVALPEDADLSTVVDKINELITKLKSAGITA